MNVQYLLSELEKLRIPSEKVVYQICNKAKQLLVEQSNVCQVKAPVTVCSNIHGQFYDILKLFTKGGSLLETNYLFLGNYVNKGQYSVQTLLYLLLLKIKYPSKLILLRGNHQSRNFTKIYGFEFQIRNKYGNTNVWKYFNELFDLLPISATINNQIFCVHAGISPSITIIDQIKAVNRVKEIGFDGTLCDFVWSDPDEKIQYWAHNQKRGAGYLFGQKIVRQFNHINNLKLILRGHSLEMEGYKEWFNKQLISIWSAPNYVCRCGNKASIIKIDDKLEYQYRVYKEDKESYYKYSRMQDLHIPYFV